VKFRFTWVFLSGAAMLPAQPQPLKYNVLYDCGPAALKLKVLSCSGEAESDTCEVQTFLRADPPKTGPLVRRTLLPALAKCKMPAPAEARAGSAAPATPAKPAQPPKPGLVSCAGKVEGRYSSTSGVTNYSITFRSGKASLTALVLGTQETDCWMDGKRIYLYMRGDPDPLPIDVNDDGTLDTPFGEIRKKGN